jgi:hypothetical protein
MSEWQDIATAPKDGTIIIFGFVGAPAGTVVHPDAPPLLHRLAGGSVDVGAWMDDASLNYWGEKGWFASDDDRLTSHPMFPSHWQPLPAPPTPEPAKPEGEL